MALTGVGAGMLVWHVAGLTCAVASTYESTAAGRVQEGVWAAAVTVVSSKVSGAGAAAQVFLAGAAGKAKCEGPPEYSLQVITTRELQQASCILPIVGLYGCCCC